MSIEKHEWFDMTVTIKNANETAVCLDTDGIPWVGIGKRDAIALAKHFKLTSDDLKVQ